MDGIILKSYISKYIKNTLIISEQDAISNLYKNGYFGRIKNEKLYLKFVEAAYLLYKKKISIYFDGTNYSLTFKQFYLYSSINEIEFELKYIVYKDLKERGYYVQSNIGFFRLYPRGPNQLNKRSKYFIFIQSERTNIKLDHLIKNINLTENVHKELIFAVVDEESDITYYNIKNLNSYISKNINSNTIYNKLNVSNTIDAILLKERVIIFDNSEAFKLYTLFFYGKQLDEFRLQLSLIEALYLLEKNIINLYDLDKNNITVLELIQKASKMESYFKLKYKIYKNLRDNFLVPKTGFKFGSHFRIYDNFNSNENLSHSEYLLHVINQNYEFKLPSLSRSIRLSNSVKKKMIFASIINNNKIIYITIERIKL